MIVMNFLDANGRLDLLTADGQLIRLHPRKLRWIPKIAISERRYVFKTIILVIYVRFRGVVYASIPKLGIDRKLSGYYLRYSKYN